MTEAPDTLLSVEDLSVTFRTAAGPLRAVRGVGFTLGRAETLALVGESGCGKSATALSLTRLLPAPPAQVTGSVRFEGENLLTLADDDLRAVRGRQIAMVFQDPMSSLNPVRTIGVQMEEMLRVHLGMSRRQARRRSAELLASVGIPSPQRQLDAYPHQLSGGMRQRVMIAMGLSCEPKVLVADEPTTALDVSIQAQILELLREAAAAHGTSLLMISHDLSVVAGMADRIAVMYAGELVETGPAAAVFDHPRHPYTKGLLECIPRLDRPRTARLHSIDGRLPDPHQPPSGCPFAPRCPLVMERCWADMPPLEEKAPGQQAACWASPSAEAGARPAWLPVEGVARLAPRSTAGNLHEGFGGQVPQMQGAAEHVRERIRKYATERAQIRGSPRNRRFRGVEMATPQMGCMGAEAPGRLFGRAPQEPLLEVRDLEVHFPIGSRLPFANRTVLRAVDGVSFEVSRGQTLSIVGESGCGKTTTGRALLRLVDVTSGQVIFDGTDLVGLADEPLRRLRPRFQMVFQDPYGSLDPRMTVSEVVAEPLRVHRAASGAAVGKRVSDLLEMVGLADRMSPRFPHQLSGGQRQRVAIARALALSPSLVVADEPTSALDVSVRAQILNLMQDLQEEHGLTYVFISHDLSIVRHMSSRVAVMYLGKVVELADRDSLYANPQHPYTRGLLATVPVPDPAIERGRTRAAMRGDVPNPADPPKGCHFNTRCPLAFERCFQEEPPLQDLGSGHRAACFLAEPEAATSVGAQA